MNPYPYSTAIRRSWAIVVVLGLLGAVIALALSVTARPSYSASASLYITPGYALTATDLNQSSAFTIAQMPSYVELATSPVVLGSTIRSLGLNTTPGALAKSLAVTNPATTTVLKIVASDAVPSRAAAIANSVAAELGGRIEALTPEVTEKRLTPIVISRIAAASTPTSSSSPNTSRNVIEGLLVGLLAGILVLVLRQAAYRRVASPEAVSSLTDAPLVGIIPRYAHLLAGGKDSTLGRPASEDYRQLAANLLSIDTRDSGLALLVTSSVPHEGSSTTAAGLALAISERGRSVLLIDANLRHPSLAETAGLDASAPGLAAVLSGETMLSAATVRISPSSVSLLPAGGMLYDPSRLLSSPAMRALLSSATELYDVVLVDSAAVDTSADAVILGAELDGALVVADTTRVDSSQFSATLDSLARARISVIGIVLNRSNHHKKHYPKSRARAARAKRSEQSRIPLIAED